MKAALLLTLIAAGCGSSSGGQPDAPDASTGTPAAPRLGTQIDRAARPLVNLAIGDTFGLTSPLPDATRDTYNAAADPAQWAALFSAEFQATLGIYDGLDGSCGNQLFAGAQAVAGRYAALARLFVDDRLYVDRTATSCTRYLALEAAAVFGAGPADCGGHTPLQNVVDETYTLLTVGAAGFGASFAIQGGVATDPDGPVDLHAFPFLTAPTP